MGIVKPREHRIGADLPLTLERGQQTRAIEWSKRPQRSRTNAKERDARRLLLCPEVIYDGGVGDAVERLDKQEGTERILMNCAKSGADRQHCGEGKGGCERVKLC